jgi:hypothetical protein
MLLENGEVKNACEASGGKSVSPDEIKKLKAGC